MDSDARTESTSVLAQYRRSFGASVRAVLVLGVVGYATVWLLAAILANSPGHSLLPVQGFSGTVPSISPEADFAWIAAAAFALGVAMAGDAWSPRFGEGRLRREAVADSLVGTATLIGAVAVALTLAAFAYAVVHVDGSTDAGTGAAAAEILGAGCLGIVIVRVVAACTARAERSRALRRAERRDRQTELDRHRQRVRALARVDGSVILSRRRLISKWWAVPALVFAIGPFVAAGAAEIVGYPFLLDLRVGYATAVLSVGAGTLLAVIIAVPVARVKDPKIARALATVALSALVAGGAALTAWTSCGERHPAAAAISTLTTAVLPLLIPSAATLTSIALDRPAEVAAFIYLETLPTAEAEVCRVPEPTAIDRKPREQLRPWAVSVIATAGLQMRRSRLRRLWKAGLSEGRRS